MSDGARGLISLLSRCIDTSDRLRTQRRGEHRANGSLCAALATDTAVLCILTLIDWNTKQFLLIYVVVLSSSLLCIGGAFTYDTWASPFG